MMYYSNSNENHLTKRIRSFIEFGEKIWKLLEFINFILFLRDGQYRTFLERILQMKMVFYNTFLFEK